MTQLSLFNKPEPARPPQLQPVRRQADPVLKEKIVEVLGWVYHPEWSIWDDDESDEPTPIEPEHRDLGMISFMVHRICGIDEIHDRDCRWEVDEFTRAFLELEREGRIETQRWYFGAPEGPGYKGFTMLYQLSETGAES
ncbi:MAG: hypothetical protein GWN58_54605 [Anaerolineae bacterium]|nr:hypothetical protein [Anaerolineae bacterium]